jgi:uncharacterized spore protein YtfJ
MKLEDIFQAIQDMREKASVNAVYGEPVTAGDKTVIPMADIKYAFGLGYGEGPAQSDEQDESQAGSHGGGVGGGIAARPVAVLEITHDEVKIKPVIDEGRIVLASLLTGVWSIFWIAMTIKALFGKK